MKRVFVEAFEDESRPQGGHAVIVLQGVEALADRPGFRLKPLDGGFISGKRSGAKSNMLTPLATRLTENGVELVVGPDIVSNPLLLAGTPVVIELPDVGVRGEFLWPNVAPLAQPRRRTVVGGRKSRPGTLGKSKPPGSGAPIEPEAEGHPSIEEAHGHASAAGAPPPAAITAGDARNGAPPIPDQKTGVAGAAEPALSPGAEPEPVRALPPSTTWTAPPSAPVPPPGGVLWQGQQGARRDRRARMLVPGLALCSIAAALAFYVGPIRITATGLPSANARDGRDAADTRPATGTASAPAVPAHQPVASGVGHAAMPSTEVAALATGKGGASAPVCGKPDVATEPVEGGRMRVRVSAPCRGGEEIRLVYGGASFAHRLGSDGVADVLLDCFAGAQTPAELRFADGRSLSVPIVADDLARVSKVAVVWRAPVNLDLHAFEYAAAHGERGHVHELAPQIASIVKKDVDSSRRGRGFMSSSDSGRGNADKIEVYTFFHGDEQTSAAIDLALDFETRGSAPAAGTCGRDENAEVAYGIVYLSRGKTILSEQGRIASADCGAQISSEARFDRTNLPVLKVRK